eukprot:scaffold2355_cov382-Prasinococcus_capsulatus_cf.AAC.2
MARACCGSIARCPVRHQAAHLEALNLGHLRRPLARSAASSMNQHPVAWLGQAGVRIVCEVMCSQTLTVERSNNSTPDSREGGTGVTLLASRARCGMMPMESDATA